MNLNAYAEIEAYYYDIQKEKRNDEFEEISYRKGSMRWNDLLQKMAFVSPTDETEKGKLEKKTIEELSAHTSAVLEKIVGDRYRASIQNLIQNTEYISKWNGKVDGFLSYDIWDDHVRNIKVKLSNVQNYMGIFFASHEYQHALLLGREEPYNAIYGNIHYHELPSMFVEKVAAWYVEEQLGEKDFQKKTDGIRISDDCSHATMPHFSTDSVESFLTEYFLAHQAATYILSDMYATRLFALYREDSKLVLKKYREFLKGDISLKDLLQFFGISIRDNETYFGYQKKLEFHQKNHI